MEFMIGHDLEFMETSTKFAFFPRNRTFWLYHGSALLAVTAANSVLNGFPVNLMTWIAWLSWYPLITILTLYFRKLYKTTRIAKFSTPKIIAFGSVYGTVAGIVMSGTTLVLTLPILLPMVKQVASTIPGKTVAGELRTIVIGGASQCQLFICLWIFIYISISHYRRNQETELVNLRLQNSLKEAQLNSLANQLNPHFLFNALNNIRFMMHESVAHADEMVVCLSDILRHSLGTSQRDKIPLSEELGIIERYIDLVKIQFDERLRFDVSVAAGLHDCLAPPMILQLLVENAVKHGVDNIRKGATISLSVSTLADQLNICLVNDIPERHALVPYAGTGTGLKNIEQRLHLLYGSEASLSRDIVDGRFVACIALPIERAL